MRTTVTIDDELWLKAKEMSGISENSELVRRVFKEYIGHEAARRLAALGGTMPDFVSAPRGGSDERLPRL